MHSGSIDITYLCVCAHTPAHMHTLTWVDWHTLCRARMPPLYRRMCSCRSSLPPLTLFFLLFHFLIGWKSWNKSNQAYLLDTQGLQAMELAWAPGMAWAWKDQESWSWTLSGGLHGPYLGAGMRTGHSLWVKPSWVGPNSSFSFEVFNIHIF